MREMKNTKAQTQKWITIVIFLTWNMRFHMQKMAG